MRPRLSLKCSQKLKHLLSSQEFSNKKTKAFQLPHQQINYIGINFQDQKTSLKQ